MVGPSITDAKRDAAGFRLKVGVVLLVAASGGLVAFQAGGSRVQIGVAIGAALLVGVLLVVFLQRLADEFYRTN